MTAVRHPIVYVVDDEPSIRRYLGVALTECGCAVSLFGQATAAVEAATRVLPDLVLLDWMMPGLNGAQAIAALRQVGCAKIVVCSAMVLPTDVERIRAAGPDDFLAKPCTIDDLEIGLRRWIAR